ncbi:MAG: DUF2652 domain-containing protein [Gammaproteobacteria bacterium]
MSQSFDTTRPALLLIPDISGFTEFVRDTEVAHSRHIIEELLEAIIAANDSGLEVSEVEGDAVFFYRFGPPPSAGVFFAQVRKMFLALHGHLRLYETQRICQCGACVSASELTLKVVAHYGRVAESRVGTHRKLFGEDVIAVHRLLKNDVPDDEYALVTHALAASWEDGSGPSWGELRRAAQDYDIGHLECEFVTLAPLREAVPEPHVEDFHIEGGTREVFSCEQLVHAPLELVFDVVSDLPSRIDWMQGAQDVEMLSDAFNRRGTRHRCLVDSSSPVMVTSDSTRSGEVITLIETDAKRTMCSVYELTREGDARTRLRIVGYLKDRLLLRVLFAVLMKRKLVAWFSDSSANLKQFCEVLHHRQLKGSAGEAAAGDGD